MDYLGKRVRIDEDEMADDRRDYGRRRYAGRVGEIVGVVPEPGGGTIQSGVRYFTVRLDDGEQIEVRPGEVRFQ